MSKTRFEHDTSEPMVGDGEDRLIRTRRRERELYAAHACRDQRADLQQLQPDGAARRARQFGADQTDTPQRRHHNVGEGGEPVSQLIGAHRRRAGAAGEQV